MSETSQPAKPAPESAAPKAADSPAPAEAGIAPAPSPVPAHPLTPDEQMAAFEKDLKENDWGHQPC